MSNLKNALRTELFRQYSAGKGTSHASDPDHLTIHSTGTLDNDLKIVSRFTGWLKERGIPSRIKPAAAAKYVQAYLDDLEARGLSPDSIHTIAFALLRAFRSTGLKSEDLVYPQRKSAPTKGRKSEKPEDCRPDADPDNPKYARLVTFARAVGIRRAEYAALKGKDIEVVNRTVYVLVQRGKGGRKQRQRIAEKDAALVTSYFTNVAPDQFVFTKEELRNKINLHKIRREYAQGLYADLVASMEADPNYREELIKEIKDAFERAEEDWRKNSDMLKLDQPYRTRGNIRAALEEKGLPTTYDRVALMYVSVLTLAHWRCDVTVKNYMM